MNWEFKLKEWQQAINLEDDLRDELLNIHSREDLNDRFANYLTFGTGGMRGELGVGINRMNIYTIKRLALGLANYICQQGDKSKEKGMVISYDNRCKSLEFAHCTAKVLASKGIKVYLSDKMRPTPQLSYLVRKCKSFGGVMITASHNPAGYNGFKIYDSDGGQITLQAVEAIDDFLSEITNELDIVTDSFEKYISEKKIIYFDEIVDRLYLSELTEVTQNPDRVSNKGQELSVVYTPLHGTGEDLVKTGLTKIGITNVHVVNKQADGDPLFSTVQSPNPEEPAAFTLAIEKGKKVNADILLATDPDSDRLGVAVKNNDGNYDLLNGNQLGVLMLDYLIRSKKKKDIDLSHYYIVKTIVTSDLGKKIATDYDIETIETLTGFKFIGEQIKFAKAERKFLFGYEESFGYLVSPFVRDKDAIQAAMLISELALECKLNNETLVDLLESIYKDYGYYFEELVTLEFAGIKGQERLKEKMTSLRKRKLNFIGKCRVKVVEDYLLGIRTLVENQVQEPLTLPQSNVIKYIFDDDSWICIRPSGTEPKCKIYSSFHGDNSKKVKEKLLDTTNKFISDFQNNE